MLWSRPEVSRPLVIDIPFTAEGSSLGSGRSGYFEMMGPAGHSPASALPKCRLLLS